MLDQSEEIMIPPFWKIVLWGNVMKALKFFLTPDDNVPVLLIGDSAFRLSRYMMKPFPYLPNQPMVE